MVKRKRSSSVADSPPSLSPARSPGSTRRPVNSRSGWQSQLKLEGNQGNVGEDSVRLQGSLPRFGQRRGASDQSLDPATSEDDADGFSDVESLFSSTLRQTDGRPAIKAAACSPRGHLDSLLRITEHLLAQGEIDKAARAFGLILHLRPGGKPIDPRKHNLWALGAEILMREGETPRDWLTGLQSKSAAANDASSCLATSTRKRWPPRWGSAASIKKVKAYFESLIQQHPYDHKFPHSTSALDFQLAMMGCEMYNAHAQHISFLAGVVDNAGHRHKPESMMPDSYTETVDHSEDPPGAPATSSSAMHPDNTRLPSTNEANAHSRALATMRDILQRLDKLMQEPPYRKHNQFIRLRAMASLYISDLIVPLGKNSSSVNDFSQYKSELEQPEARQFLEELEKPGARLESVFQTIIQHDTDSKEPSHKP